jgi:hypothetical protein
MSFEVWMKINAREPLTDLLLLRPGHGLEAGGYGVA